MKKYSYEEALEASTKYFNGDDLAAKAFVTKYALQDADGNILELTPDDTHKRVAKELARVEKKKFKDPMSTDEIYLYLKNFEKIIPQGSCLYGIGNKYQYVTLSNCYVIPPVEDSYLGINYTDTQIAAISGRRGGVGWDISKLRPEGFNVKNAAKSTTGAVSFMHRFSNTINEVCQFGRRGASLQCMDVRHPDIMDFIKSKNDNTSITGSNISVKFTDEFMKALFEGTDFEQRWPVDSDIPTISKNVDPQEIWDEFIKNAHLRAEPGAIFIDTVHNRSTSAPYPGYAETAPNPCGEQYLPPFTSCRLIAINLYSYVKDKFTKKASFDDDTFIHDVQIMQRLADDIVDLDIESVERIIKKIKADPEPMEVKQAGIDLWENVKQRAIEDRRTGCGILGLADCLAALGLKYDSEEAKETCDIIFEQFKVAAYASSINMAKELGAFPLYNNKTDFKSQFIYDLKHDFPDLYNDMTQYGRRNMTLLTIAPTGTISLVAQVSSGLEPVFMLSYTRRKKINPSEKNVQVDFVDDNGVKWSHHEVNHRAFQDWKDITGKEKIEDSPYHNACSHEIDFHAKTALQATIQKHIDNSISVTTNLPADVDLETVDKLYKDAYKLGCKGYTIYRDGSRSGVLISSDQKETLPNERPTEIDCDVYHLTRSGIRYVILIGTVDGIPYEMFGFPNRKIVSEKVHKGKIIKLYKSKYRAEFDNGEEAYPITSFMSEDEETFSRMVSLLLRQGAQLEDICKQLSKTGGKLGSFAKATEKVLSNYLNGKSSGDKCPQCSADLLYIEGCKKCSACEYSAC